LFYVFHTLKLLLLIKKWILEELDLTLGVGMFLPLVVSLYSNQKLEEAVRDKGLLGWVLKIERI
jgi:hypothetical protein